MIHCKNSSILRAQGYVRRINSQLENLYRHSPLLKFVLLFLFIVVLFVRVTHPTQADTSVSLSVPPGPSDFQFTLTSVDSQDHVNSGKVLTYTITYGAKASAAFSTVNTIVVNFQNTKSDSGTEILDYVQGSASLGYKGSAPVVDLIHRKITWNMTSLLPGVTDQTVTFQLQANGNYQGTDAVPYTLEADMSNEYTSLPTQYIYGSYLYVPPPPGPTSTPTPGAIIPTPTPSPQPITNLQINSVFFTEVTNTDSSIHVSANKPATFTLSYGTSPHALNSLIAIPQASYSQEIGLQALSPNTTYYFQIAAITPSGEKSISDVYTFQTTSTPPVAIQETPNPPTVILSSAGNVLQTITLQGKNQHFSQTILPIAAEFSVAFAPPPTLQVKQIEAVIRNKFVLAASTLSAPESNLAVVPMVGQGKGIFAAQLTSPTEPGTYEVYAHITDVHGNITENKISELKVLQPFTIIDAQTRLPIQDARVFLQFYNSLTKTYLPINEQFGTINNPLFTLRDGALAVTLPSGQYKATIDAFPYNERTVSFTVGDGHDLPQVALTKNVFALDNYFHYYINALFDTGASIGNFVKGLSVSLRFFNILALLSLVFFVLLTIIAFSSRTIIPLFDLPIYFLHHLHKRFNQGQDMYLAGIVLDGYNQPLPKAIVLLHDSSNRAYIKTITNKLGRFYVRLNNSSITHISVTKEGFNTLTHLIEEFPKNGLGALQLTLHEAQHRSPLLYILFSVPITILGLLFESTLTISIVCEILLLPVFGVFKTLPFLLLSFINILMWVWFEKEKREKRELIILE